MGTRLKGKVAIVTGSSRGIGLAIAKAFAKEGAKVVVSSRKPEGVEAAAAEINAAHPGAAFPLPLHVGHVEDHVGFVGHVAAEIGIPDILVNNAAANPYYGPLTGLGWGAFDKTVEVNLKGSLGLAIEVSKRLMEADRTGSVINLASVYGLAAAPLQGIYGMTKAAMISLTQTMAHEWGRQGIRVNAIAPGLVETRFAAAILEDPEYAGSFNSRSAIGRHAQPEEISGLAVYLASDEASFVTGQCFPVDGGYTSG
jgi:NAD(P)-dependent dehydrogenase (short-subunit alcohol dehydrogenase family)